MAQVIWSEPAISQLEDILEYIALDKPEAAKGVAKRITEATDHLETFVKIGKRVPEIDHPNYRQVWIQPCWIYYRIDKEQITILHIRRSERPLRIDDLLR